jgi:anti-sigma regulatory factor (Ser/Thr protein kinase)
VNPGLQINVRRWLPITVAQAEGSLETGTLAIAEPVLRECLAYMPSALILDGTDLQIAPSGHLWLLGLAQSAQRWPGAQLVVTGEHTGLPTDGTLRASPTVDTALKWLDSPEFPERRQLTLPPDPASCGLARALVSQACADWGMRRAQRLAELLISELVANGVRHAQTKLKVTVRRTDGEIELSVRDHGTGKLPGDTEMDDPRGFGLQLLAALSDSWGWSPAGQGKVVWTRLQGVI